MYSKRVTDSTKCMLSINKSREQQRTSYWLGKDRIRRYYNVKNKHRTGKITNSQAELTIQKLQLCCEWQVESVKRLHARVKRNTMEQKC